MRSLLLLLTFTGLAAAEPKPAHGDPARLDRIRAAKMPAVTRPVSFDTPEADAILAALEVFPPDNPWNLLVEDWPVHPKSKTIVTSVGPGKPFRATAPQRLAVEVPPCRLTRPWAEANAYSVSAIRKTAREGNSRRRKMAHKGASSGGSREGSSESAYCGTTGAGRPLRIGRIVGLHHG